MYKYNKINDVYCKRLKLNEKKVNKMSKRRTRKWVSSSNFDTRTFKWYSS